MLVHPLRSLISALSLEDTRVARMTAVSLCHYRTQSRAAKTPHSTPPLHRLTAKCQNPKADRDHNKLITNRKWLHYGLKVRRRCSLVTALTQIHTFLQGLGRAGSSLRTVLPGHCLRPGAQLRVSGALRGWPAVMWIWTVAH